MHTHRTLMANVVGGGEWGSGSAESIVLGVVPMFHITGMLYGVISPMFGGATVVIMPRWDRELAGRLISRHKVSHWTCIPTMIIDLFASPNYRQLRPEQPALAVGRRRGDAAGRGAAPDRRVRAALLRGLRPHRDGRAQPRQPGRAAQAAVPGHAVLRRRLARGRSGHAQGTAARRDRRDRHARPDGVPRLLEEPGGHGRGVRRDRRAAAISAPATSGTWTPTATSSSPTASSA